MENVVGVEIDGWNVWYGGIVFPWEKGRVWNCLKDIVDGVCRG